MRLDSKLKALIQHNLNQFQATPLRHEGQKAAAVAIAVTHVGPGGNLKGLKEYAGWNTQAALILTRRAASLRQHSGQWALPGGRIDDGESAEQAALRELEEEVGLKLGPDAVMGRLDDFATRSGYVITPLVVWAGSARHITPNPGEVQSIHRIPITEFQRADAPILNVRQGSEHPVLLMPVGDSWIAAPTAAFLYQFREVCIASRNTRVAHFEQPDFAWK